MNCVLLGAAGACTNTFVALAQCERDEFTGAGECLLPSQNCRVRVAERKAITTHEVTTELAGRVLDLYASVDDAKVHSDGLARHVGSSRVYWILWFWFLRYFRIRVLGVEQRSEGLSRSMGLCGWCGA